MSDSNSPKSKAERIRSRVLLSALTLGSASLGAGHAFAQAQAPAAQTTTAQKNAPSTDEGATLDAVVVTASRVQRTGFTSPTPTTVLGADDLQKTGSVTIADLLNQVPAFGNSSTPGTTTVSSQNAGGNFLNLRSLGTTRTLVLVDGQRHVPTTSTGLIDTNVIPTVLIDRVEVVTGGASAAWGSDAVAGVVNLILKKKIDGVQGFFNYGVTQYGDFRGPTGGLAVGKSFLNDRLRIMVAGEGSDSSGGPPGSDRDWVNAGYQRYANPAYTATNGQPQYLISPNVRTSNATLGGLITSGVLSGTQFLPGGATAPFTYGTNVGANYMVGGDGVNLGVLFNHLATPLTRGNIFGRVAFDVTPNIEAYAELSAAYSQTIYGLDSSYDLGTITIQRDNAYLPPSVRTALTNAGQTSFKLGRVNRDLGEYAIDDINSTRRFVAGLDGNSDVFGVNWKWNAYYEYGHTRYAAAIGNNRINANFTNAIDAVTNSAGQIVCRSTLTSPNNGCAPINLFGDGSAANAQALAYVNGTQTLVSNIEEQAGAFNVQGEPFRVWAGPVSVAAGFEVRRESLTQVVDALSLASSFNIGNPKPISGAFDVREGFLETVVPLIAGVPFIKSLDFNGAVRETDYSTSGSVTTWKLGLTYAVDEDLSFRFTQSRDIRAPNLSELYSSYVLTFATVTDPLNGNVQTQVQSPTQGNTALVPEQADTTTWGVIYRPSWLKGLSASIDVYDIVVNGAISTLATQDIINRCDNGSNTSLCQFIVLNGTGLSRNSVVYRKTINLSEIKTNGLDIEARYALPFHPLSSNLSLRYLANYVGDIITNDGRTLTNHGGDAGADAGGLPHWRMTGNLTADRGPASAFLQARYIGGGPYDSTPTGTISPNHVSSQIVWDASVTYRLSIRGAYNIELFGLIDNLFNKDPPISPTSFIASAGTNKAIYDFEGRRFQVGVRFKY